jgi:ABC-2 type transport system permease protein
MFRLLGIEWMKLKSYKAFWVFAILFMVLHPILLFACKKIFTPQPDGDKDLIETFARSIMSNPFAFPGFWHFSAYCAGLIVILLGLIIVMHTCNEYNYKTHRQNIIDGWSRKQFISAKLILITAMSFIVTLYYVIVTLIYGSATISNTSEIFNPNGLVFIFYFFIECMVYLTFALMIGILLRRAGLAIGLFFIYAYLIDNIMFGWFIKDTKAIRFLPLDAADSLVNNQMMQRVPQFQIDDTLRMGLLIACIGYILVYSVISYIRFSKKDL